jgi:hypothetical protein
MRSSAWCLICVLLLGGCSFFGTGKDTNKLTVENKGCTVSLSQLGKVTGNDETSLVESVDVKPDCTVIIRVTDDVGPNEKE